MPTYFTLAELVKSDTAKRLGIDNSPTWAVVEHLRTLVEEFLDPLRSAWGKPIRVTSGYRCKNLNAAIGGASTSVHMIGYAADLQTGCAFNKFCDFVVEWARKTGRKFDQILVESDKKTGAQWIHVGLYSNSGAQRGQVKTMSK